MEGFDTAHHCPFCLFLDDLQPINGLNFLFLSAVLRFFSLTLLSLLLILLLLLCILHDDQLLQILDLLPHIANHLILPLNLRPQIQNFPLVAPLLSLYLCFEVVIDSNNTLLEHMLILMQLLPYITFEPFTNTHHHFPSLSHFFPSCCYLLLLPSETVYFLLKMDE